MSRVSRLAQQLRPKAEDERARVAKMTDEELECHIQQLLEKEVGPLESYSTVDGLISALEEICELSSLLDVGRRLWHRLHWFELHAAHGGLELVRIQPESWRSGRPWGLQMVFECPCSDRIATYEDLVREPFRRLTPRQTWGFRSR